MHESSYVREIQRSTFILTIWLSPSTWATLSPSLSLSLSLSLTNNFPYNAVLAVPLLRPLVWCLLFLNLDIPTGFLSHPSLFPSHSHSHSDHVIIASANILTKRILNMRRVSFRRVALRYVCSLRGHS